MSKYAHIKSGIVCHNNLIIQQRPDGVPKFLESRGVFYHLLGDPVDLNNIRVEVIERIDK
ncbi:hypothetical protein D3C86_2100040 [compost metagenome]